MKIPRVLLCAACLMMSQAGLHAQQATETASASKTQEEAAIAAVSEESSKVLSAFNAGKVDELASMFMSRGEIIDELGNVYRGEKEIKEILTSLFERFPGATLALAPESIRLVGPIAIEEGIRSITTKEGDVSSRFRYIAVWGKSDKGWRIASHRDFADDPAHSG